MNDEEHQSLTNRNLLSAEDKFGAHGNNIERIIKEATMLEIDPIDVSPNIQNKIEEDLDFRNNNFNNEDYDLDV